MYLQSRHHNAYTAREGGKRMIAVISETLNMLRPFKNVFREVFTKHFLRLREASKNISFLNGRAEYKTKFVGNGSS